MHATTCMHRPREPLVHQCAQVQEYRYNVKFADDFASVSYTNHNFQSFAPNDSCSTCALSDTLVSINRSAMPCDAAVHPLFWPAIAWQAYPVHVTSASLYGVLHAGHTLQLLPAMGIWRQPC